MRRVRFADAHPHPIALRAIDLSPAERGEGAQALCVVSVMTNPRPSPRIRSAKPGKLVAMKAASSTVTGRVARQAHHQRRHGDAMVHVGRDRAAARHARPLPCTIRSSPAISTVDAVGAQHVGGGGEAVGFLDAQLLEAAHHGGAVREGRRDREHRILVDHRGRALGRHLDAAQLPSRARGNRPSARRRRRAPPASRCARPSRAAW